MENDEWIEDNPEVGYVNLQTELQDWLTHAHLLQMANHICDIFL